MFGIGLLFRLPRDLRSQLCLEGLAVFCEQRPDLATA